MCSHCSDMQAALWVEYALWTGCSVLQIWGARADSVIPAAKTERPSTAQPHFGVQNSAV